MHVDTTQKRPRKAQIRWHRRSRHPVLYVFGLRCNCHLVACPENRLKGYCESLISRSLIRLIEICERVRET